MSWQPIDFQGIVSLDTPIINILHTYLDEREAHLGQSIIEAIPQSPQLPSLSCQSVSHLKLSEAIEIFNKKCAQNVREIQPSEANDYFKHSISKINKPLWEYVEVLAGCGTELFQQIELMGLDQWHARLPNVVGAIKDLLVHKTEELTWAIKRLEDQLTKYKTQTNLNQKNSIFTKIAQFFTTSLDQELLSNLSKNQTYLKTQYDRFIKRYEGYVKLEEQVDHELEKFNIFNVLPSLENETQHLFKKTYQLIKLWKLNQTAKTLPSSELVFALRHVLSTEKATKIFKDYYIALKRHLFMQSRTLKFQGTALYQDSPIKSALQAEITTIQTEIHMLATTIANYRDFLLRVDPDPSVRSRLGLSEYIAGSEPTQTKPLLDLVKDIEQLNFLAQKLSNSIIKEVSLNLETAVQGSKMMQDFKSESFEMVGDHSQSVKAPTISNDYGLKDCVNLSPSTAVSRLNQAETIAQIDIDIQKALHEMGQPLAKQQFMKATAEKVLEKMDKLDEWGAFSFDVVDYVGGVFSKLLRYDWKYNVLYDFPLFYQLFAIHQGMVTPLDDRAHVNRMNKFKKLLNQIQDWVTRHKTQSHFHDIELDMNDIKVYLQDFLAHVQRVVQDTNLQQDKAILLRADIAQQLLEYRYIFGLFFYHLRQNESEGQIIRRQFLFVDQYFDSIEQRLQELHNRDFSNPEHSENLEDEEA